MTRKSILLAVGIIAATAAMLSVGSHLKAPQVCYGHGFGWKVQVDALGNDMTKNPYIKVVVSETDKNLLVNGRHVDTVSLVEAMAARYDLRSELPTKRENEPQLGSRPVN